MEVFGKRPSWMSFICILAISLTLGCAKEDPGNEHIFPVSNPDCRPDEIAGEFVVEWESGAITLEKGSSREEFIKSFVKPNRDFIRRAEHNYKLFTPAPVEVSTKSSTTMNWGMDAINAEKAWDEGILGADKNGNPVIVAIIDSGVYPLHQELYGQFFVNLAEKTGKPGVDDDGNGYVDDVSGWNYHDNSPDPDDESGHGTHVAGIVAARHDVGHITGVAPAVKILPLDFINGQYGDSAHAIQAIIYAADMGAKVINASWGGRNCSKVMYNEIAKLEAKKVLFVTAAGNSGQDISTYLTFPAAFDLPSQITTAATTENFYMANFSNYGDLVHVAAPGADIVSLYIDETSLAKNSGTSMASPFVAGVAALLMGYHPEATIHQIRTAILETTQEPVDAPPFATLTGGEIRVEEALNKLDSLLEGTTL